MVFTQEEINLRYQNFFNGKETIRLGVAVALINQKNEILLEKRSDCGWWGVTGGKLDLGETVQDCAVREIKEECNVLVESKLLKLVGVYSDPEEGRILQYPDNRVHLIDIVYIFKSNYFEFKKSHESLELKFFTFDRLPDLIVPPAIKPLQDIYTIFK